MTKKERIAEWNVGYNRFFATLDPYKQKVT